MKREYPSTPEEAFEASVGGAYYAKQMAKAELERRINRPALLSRLLLNALAICGPRGVELDKSIDLINDLRILGSQTISERRRSIEQG